MANEFLEITEKLIDRININIKNKETRELILNNISRIMNDSRAKLDVTNNWFIGTIKTNKDFFTVTFFPSLEELKDIFIEGAEKNGFHKFNRVIRIDSDMVRVNDIHQHLYVSNDSNSVSTLQKLIVEETYLENNLVYSNNSFIESSNKSNYVKQKSKYYLSSGKYVECQQKIVDDVVLSNRYFEYDSSEPLKFDNNNQSLENNYLPSNEEQFNMGKDEVEEALDRRKYYKM